MTQKEFLSLGFSQGEAEIYDTLIQLGRASAATLSQKTGRHRTHIYDTITKLKEKGLVAENITDGTRIFSPTAPENLVDYFEEKKERAQKLVKDLKKPSEVEKNEVIVETFTGKSGIKSVIQDLLRENKDFLVYGEGMQFEAMFPIFYQKYRQTIQEKKLKTKVIMKNTQKIPLREGMELRQLDYLSPSTNFVYGNKVVIILWKPFPTAIRITNDLIAESHKSYFQIMWKDAKKVG
ncbi:MAG: helix-turn-helix domain-containing protein [archaeon]|jgi:sugar-specific transcriptional regulator TrmB